MLEYDKVVHFVMNSEEAELKKLSNSAIYGLMLCLRNEAVRRQTPKRRGKHKPQRSILPIPRELKICLQRLNGVWANKPKKKKV